MATTNRFRFTVADGDPTWSKGWKDYAQMYSHVWDRLRFHRGKGFTIDKRPAELRLIDVEAELFQIVKNQPAGKNHIVESKLDGYRVMVERFEVEDLHGRDVTDHLRNAIGTPYVLGGWGLGGMDCSGSTGWSHAFEGVTLPHKASWQHDLFRNHEPGFHLIGPAELLEGDLIFLHGDDHVATFLDRHPDYGLRVLDEEPHDTQAPSAWPSSFLGTGLRIRPASGNYYCAFQYANGFGRIEKINGKP